VLAAVRAMKQLLEWDIAQISETVGVLNRQTALPKELPEMLAREREYSSASAEVRFE
jgi:hypothetical protein